MILKKCSSSTVNNKVPFIFFLFEWLPFIDNFAVSLLYRNKLDTYLTFKNDFVVLSNCDLIIFSQPCVKSFITNKEN